MTILSVPHNYSSKGSLDAVKVNKKIMLEQMDEAVHQKGSDYTKERNQWLGNLTLEEIKANFIRKVKV